MWARKPVNHTSWVVVVTPTDRPKSVRNRCLIELFRVLFVSSLCPFDISVGVGAFIINQVMKIIDVADFEHEALDRNILIYAINSSQFDITRLQDV